jgi:cytidine deaminase
MAQDIFDREKLIDLARSAAERAHCPYSRFRVGAAVVADDKIYTGANIENSSYGLTLCAERSALAAAMSAGASRVTHITVSCLDADPRSDKSLLMPCGACRQWFSELAPMAVIVVDGVEGEFSASELLPTAFRI